MQRVLLIAIFVAALLPSHTLKAQVTINGLVDCGVWVKARETDRSSALEHRLLGLLNGMALGSKR